MSVLKRCSAVCLVLLSGIAAQGKDAGQEELPPAETDISNPVMFRLRMNRFFARVGPFARWIPTGKGKHTVCIVKQEKDGLVLTLAGRSPELPRQAVGTFWKAACFEFSVPVSFLGKKLQFECRVSGPVETLSICGMSGEKTLFCYTRRRAPRTGWQLSELNPDAAKGDFVRLGKVEGDLSQVKRLMIFFETCLPGRDIRLELKNMQLVPLEKEPVVR